MQLKLTKVNFDETLNTGYRVKPQGNGVVELKLIKSEERNVPGLESFCLIFEGTDDLILHDNTYKFEHDVLGSFELFISPYLHKGDKVYYDAQFARVID